MSTMYRAEDAPDLILEAGRFHTVSDPDGRGEQTLGLTQQVARWFFLAGDIGSLEIGGRTDLVVSSRDIMAVPAEEVPGVAIDMTLIGGNIAYRREEMQ